MNAPVSLAIWCVAASWFVQVTVVPAGTETEAGLKAKFWTVIATGGGGARVVWVTWAVVCVVPTVVATVVVRTVVTGVGGWMGWVGTGVGPGEGLVQPAVMIAARRRIPRIAYPVRKGFMLMEVPHGMMPYPL